MYLDIEICPDTSIWTVSFMDEESRTYDFKKWIGPLLNTRESLQTQTMYEVVGIGCGFLPNRFYHLLSPATSVSNPFADISAFVI
jgi:hypothetical protein